MGIERASTPEFQLIVGDNWPELDEITYASRASEQFANGQQMTQGASTVSNMASTVDANMEGATASASEAKSAERMSAMTAKSATFSNRATSTALAGQNILGTKTALNGIAEGYEVSWNTIKTQAVAEGWDQAQLQEAKDALVDEFKGQADKVGSNFEQTDSELKTQIKTGAEPAVPASMPGGGAAGGLELPPELMGQMQGMLGQGMGMAQQLPQQLQGALGPLGEQAQQGLDKVLQAVGGGAGGDVGVTPEMLDTMLAGQESGGDSGGSEPKGAEAAESEDGFKGENTDAAQASPVSLQTGGEEAAPGGGAGAGGDEVANAASAPSPAESPVTAAPPASASIPETQLSGDSGSRDSSSGSPAGGSGAGGAGGAGASSAFRGDDQGVSRQSPVSDAAAGTHLTADTMTAPPPAAGSLGSPAGAAGALGGMGAGGLGAGMSAGGMGAGGLGAGGVSAMGAPMAGVPSTPAAGAPTPPAPAATPAAGAPAPPAPAAPGASAPTSGTPSNTPTAPVSSAPAAGATSQLSAIAPARDGGVAGPGIVPAAVPAGGNPGAVQHMGSANYTDAERRAGAVAAAVNTAFARAGVVSPVAVALLKDGLSVFVTSDGLGVLPHGVALPVDVIPLSALVEVNDLFRQDMTGCQNPGYVLKTVVDLGLIEDVRAIVATDNGTTEGVTYVTANDLKGASPLSLVVHRDQFAGISVDDIAEAIETVRRDWGLASKLSVEDALLNVTLSRWETVNDPQASKALAAWMIADAEESAANGRTGEAAYILLQAIYLGRPDD